MLVSKCAGVHQGDPASAILFSLVMEFARMLIPPSKRPTITLRASLRGDTFRMEIDYADYQLRVTDSIMDMQVSIDALAESLAKVLLVWEPTKTAVAAMVYNGRTKPIELFDPRIKWGVDDEGNDLFIEAILDDASIKVVGVHMNYRLQAHDGAQSMVEREAPRLNRIAASDYPIPAKLEAIYQGVTRASEHLHAVPAFITNEALRELDVMERKTTRAFLGGMNLPNKSLEVEQRTSARTARREIISLANIVHFLGSTDSRVKSAALMMTRDAEWTALAGALPGDTLLSPRFFEWTTRTNIDIPQVYSPTSIPARYARFARDQGVALYEESGQLVVELDGQTVLHPEHLMQKLAKRLRKRQLQDLEQRLSTNTRKNEGEQGGPAPEYSISWGTRNAGPG